MGGHARGAGLTGAPHAMLVNELIITAVTGTTTHGAPPRTDKRQAPPRRALPSGPLPGGIEAWATETSHTITGKFNVIPDAIVHLPELGIPVAFPELDRGTMTDIRKVAGKLDNYKRYFDRTVHDGGQERLEVEVRYNVPEPAHGYRHRLAVRPPVLFVLDQGTRGSRARYSPQALEQRLEELRNATWEHWQGRHTSRKASPTRPSTARSPCSAPPSSACASTACKGPSGGASAGPAGTPSPTPSTTNPTGT
ncbi:replication-relaxation family protein [Kitasatospora sp. NPDC056327]|uniref:replication-relaxation family protein n=1 Tax=Kitasatospora sp. NPDC056327 TaxID=3345785 RepID=UPI0035D85E67